MRVRIRWKNDSGLVLVVRNIQIPANDNDNKIRMEIQDMLHGAIVRVGDTFTVTEEEA